MWWRALGVAVVLLCVGVAGGYAVADRTADEPRQSAGPEPLPAEPLPTPPDVEVLPDPDIPPLATGLPGEEKHLRLTRRGAGISVQVPVGWRENRLPNSRRWTYVGPENVSNTYYLRVEVLIGTQVAATLAKRSRIEALELSAEEGNLQSLVITGETDTGFEATYVFDGYRKVDVERWVALDSGIAYANIAVVGREADTAGLRDLVAKVTDSVGYLDAVPEGEKVPKP